MTLMMKPLLGKLSQWPVVAGSVETLLHYFGITRSRFPDPREHLQAALILLFSFVYIVAWLAHIPIYIAMGNFQAAALVAALGVTSAILALVLLKFKKNMLAALSANLGGLSVLLAITLVTGGMNSPIPAWLFFGTMTTFLLMGAKAGWVMTAYILAGLGVVTVLQVQLWLPESGFPFGVDSENFTLFALFVYVVSIVSLSAVTTIYEFLQLRAFSQLRVAMTEIEEQHTSILLMLNHIKQGLLTILPNGVVHEQHSAFLRDILGHSNVAGQKFEKLLFESMQYEKTKKERAQLFLREAFGKPLSLFLSGSEGVLPAEVPFLNAHGVEKMLGFDWIPLSDDGVLVSKIMVSIRDITLVRRLEKEAKIVEQQRVSQSKMAALGEMAGGVAHEINNPLAVIEMKASLIELGEFDSANGREVIVAESAAIRKQVDRIGRIVRSLLSFARQNDADPMRAVDVATVIADVSELLTEKSRKNGIHLVFENALKERARVHGDHSKIMQILLNFLNNAFYALENSSVPHREVRIRSEELENGLLKISVHDNGPGIPAEHHDKVMDPFFTTKPVGVGTGIGLSLSRSLALEMKGSIDFSSSPGDTTFFVLLNPEPIQAAQN